MRQIAIWPCAEVEEEDGSIDKRCHTPCRACKEQHPLPRYGVVLASRGSPRGCNCQIFATLLEFFFEVDKRTGWGIDRAVINVGQLPQRHSRLSASKEQAGAIKSSLKAKG
jgi:hypothetical protein